MDDPDGEVDVFDPPIWCVSCPPRQATEGDSDMSSETLDDRIMHRLRTTGVLRGDVLAERLGADEVDVMAALNRLKHAGLLRLTFTTMPVQIDLLPAGRPEEESDS